MPAAAPGLRRLEAQRVSRPGADPVEVVRHLLAVQAQDLGAATRAVGLRTRGATAASVEQALDDGALVRTHSLRGTWQVMHPADVRWVLDLVAPVVLARSAKRERDLALDEQTLTRSRRLLAEAVAEGNHCTRAELTLALERGGLSLTGPRLGQVLLRAELEQVLCSGRRKGAQVTWAAFAERIPAAPTLERTEAARRLAERYFASRAPATVEDFLWWSGLAPAEARAAAKGLDAPGTKRASASPRAHLLPAFDEFLISYADRSDVLDPVEAPKVSNGGVLSPCVVVDGSVAGTWKKALRRRTMEIEVLPFRGLSGEVRDAVGLAAEGASRFEGLALELTFSEPRGRPKPVARR
jgi:hypothetical protein